MLFSTVGQASVFAWMLAAGAVIGAWYACMAALRRLLSAGPWLSLAADAAFGAGAGAIFCLALYAANYGRLRLYCVLASVLGFALFALGVFPPVRAAVRSILAAFRRIFVKISRVRWIKVIFR